MVPVSHGAPIEIRAFRGTRRASVYREHVLSEAAFERIVAVGAEHGLGVLSSLDPADPHEFDKREAQRLAHDADELRRSSELPDLDGDLTALGEIARWCARASGRSWLTIAGP